MKQSRVRRRPAHLSIYPELSPLSPASPSIRLTLMAPLHARTLHKLTRAPTGNVQFKKDQWLEHDMNAVCRSIGEWGIDKGLYVVDSRATGVLRALAGISFPELVRLNLRGNQIESLEPIRWTRMPCLQQLILADNLITSIGALRTAALPQLQTCSLRGNPIKDFSPLQELHCPRLKFFLQEGRHDKLLCDSFAWIVKLQTKQLESLFIRSDHRLWEKALQNCMERKYRLRKEITFYVGIIEGVGDNDNDDVV